jgi:hypothetical protein
MSQRVIRNIFFVICTAALACCPLSATSTASAGRPHSVNHAAATSDAQLQAAIAAKLAKSKIGKDGFKFHVQKGIVTWEGTTSVMQHKGSATRMARTAGAVQVVNNIKVSDAGKEHAMANLKKAQVSE